MPARVYGGVCVLIAKCVFTHLDFCQSDRFFLRHLSTFYLNFSYYKEGWIFSYVLQTFVFFSSLSCLFICFAHICIGLFFRDLLTYLYNVKKLALSLLSCIYSFPVFIYFFTYTGLLVCLFGMYKL